MNMTQMMSMMQNPQQFAMAQMMQQMVRENPDKWQQAQQLLNGKSQKQQVTALEKLYKERGMDLRETAARFGIAL